MPLLLPPQFTSRPPVLEDADTIVGLMQRCQPPEYRPYDGTAEELNTVWKSPTVNLERDFCLVFAPTQELIGYFGLRRREPSRMNVTLKIDPAYQDSGLPQAFLNYAEELAREYLCDVPEHIRVSLLATCPEPDHAYQQTLEETGFHYIRSSQRMLITMDEPPPAPVWPEGIELRPFHIDMLRTVYEADDEAFRDHWGYIPLSYESFEHLFTKRSIFDPTLWFLPFAGEELTATALCAVHGSLPWVESLSVRRPWRKRGLALALLHHAFGEFYRRGARNVVLFVDAQSLTGATRLYQRAGMHVERQYDEYEKELRPGVELAIQSLEESV